MFKCSHQESLSLHFGLAFLSVDFALWQPLSIGRALEIPDISHQLSTLPRHRALLSNGPSEHPGTGHQVTCSALNQSLRAGGWTFMIGQSWVMCPGVEGDVSLYQTTWTERGGRGGWLPEEGIKSYYQKTGT